jgi:hypothetical protein
MIRYNKKISVKQHSTGQWRIDTDRGDQYQLTQIQGQTHPITDWWSMNHQSELRGWQMDIFVKGLTYKGNNDDYVLWLAHKAGGGLSQPHDIVIMYHQGMKLWVLSTEQHHWLQPGNLTDTDFLKDDAIAADILKVEDRKEIYPILDHLNLHYNQMEKI